MRAGRASGELAVAPEEVADTGCKLYDSPVPALATESRNSCICWSLMYSCFHKSFSLALSSSIISLILDSLIFSSRICSSLHC
jgi:hypothetical protein